MRSSPSLWQSPAESQLKATRAACKIHEEKPSGAHPGGGVRAPKAGLQCPASPAGALGVLVTPPPLRPEFLPAAEPSGRPFQAAPAYHPRPGRFPAAGERASQASQTPPAAARSPPGGPGACRARPRELVGRAGVGRQRPPLPAPIGRQLSAPGDRSAAGLAARPVTAAPIGWGGPVTRGGDGLPRPRGSPLVRF